MNAKTTLAWQASVTFPSKKYTNNNGMREIINDNNEFETWTEISKLNESSY